MFDFLFLQGFIAVGDLQPQLLYQPCLAMFALQVTIVRLGALYQPPVQWEANALILEERVQRTACLALEVIVYSGNLRWVPAG